MSNLESLWILFGISASSSAFFLYKFNKRQKTLRIALEKLDKNKISLVEEIQSQNNENLVGGIWKKKSNENLIFEALVQGNLNLRNRKGYRPQPLEFNLSDIHEKLISIVRKIFKKKNFSKFF